MNRQTGGPDAGACHRARASNEHGVAPGRIRRLHRGLPPRRVGVRIRQRSVRSGPGDRGPRELRLPERVGIRIVPGVRPGRPADTGRGRGLVRPARRRGWRPGPGLAGGQPPGPRRDRPIWPGHTPRRPGTRPDMAGRQRQLVFLTPAARRRNDPDASAFPPDPLSRRQMSVLLLSWPRHDSGAGQIGSGSMSRSAALSSGRSACWSSAATSVRPSTCYTGAAARARTARPCRRAALGRLTS